MKNRRTYAALDKNIQIKYTVNGKIMGSTLDSPGTFRFAINIEDPDSKDADDKITKIDIVKDKGEVVQTYTPDTPAHAVTWSPTIEDGTSKYFFVRVWNAGAPPRWRGWPRSGQDDDYGSDCVASVYAAIMAALTACQLMA